MDDESFLTTWRQMAGTDRRRVRRLSRIGRIEEGSADEEVAVAMARLQTTRPWWRFFWIWFVPGLVIALGMAMRIHPVMIGVVLAFAGQAVLTRRNVGRLARRQ
jgi:hypothetical protein